MTYTGDCLDILPTLDANSVQCCVTSPPYWGLRDYGVPGQLGLEKTPEEYVEKMVAVFREVKRVLRDDGTLWLNLGDSYAANRGYQVAQTKDANSKRADAGQFNDMPFHVPVGLKPKDLVGIPWRVAFALQADGWWLRSDIIWHKPNPMPESVTDRPTKAHEYVFLLSKSAKYFFDQEAVKEDGKIGSPNRIFGAKKQEGTMRHDIGRTWTDNGTRNRRSVWTITTKPFKGLHFATFPPEIPEICIKAGSRAVDTILDPFSGEGTTGLVAEKLGRKYIGIELNPAYVEMSERRIEAARLPMAKQWG
jgi:DNA modification methylase